MSLPPPVLGDPAGTHAVWLDDVGPSPLVVIREVRAVGLTDLAGAKRLIDEVPSCVGTFATAVDAAAFAHRLRSLAARVRITGVERPAPGPAPVRYHLRLDRYTGSKLEAVKTLRDLTAWSLAETVQRVDALPLRLGPLAGDAAVQALVDAVAAGFVAELEEVG